MIKLLSLFSGIGAFEAALRRGGYQFETVNYCEIDPYASKAYSQIHGISEDYNLHDVRQVNTLLLDNINLMTWGWPCQDISVAGKQRGFKDNDGNLTRSGLFFQGLRILTELQPEYAIAENVKALTGKKFTAEFETVLTSLDKAGYNNYWKVLNAKDYGIPQNRERVFIVSIRKDVDLKVFSFPEKQPLDLRLKDMLEDSVDEKYYLNSGRAKSLISQIQERYTIQEPEGVDGTVKNPKVKDVANCIQARYDQGIYHRQSEGTAVIEPQVLKYERTEYGKAIRSQYEKGEIEERRCNMREFSPRNDGISNTLTTVQKDNYVLDPKKVQRLGNLYNENAGGARAGNVYAPDGLAPALQTAQGGNRMPLITEPIIAASRGRNPDNPGDRTTGLPTEQRLEVNTQGMSNTLTTVQKDNLVVEPQILKYERTEYAKSIRKEYENGELSERRCNMRQYTTRKDGMSNTLSTVQKDNYLLEPKKILQPIVIGSTQKHASVNTDGTAPCLTAMMGLGGGNVPMVTDNQIDCCGYRIRKLTPRECFRLMGFTDEDFDKIKGISNTQLYKMAGNSIVVNVLEAIFKQLFKENHKE